MFKNPFDNTIYFESEVGDKEVITEVDLINKIPKELDKYFFDGKSISSLYEVQSKSTLDILKPTSISIGVVLIIFYIFTNVF